MPTEDFVGNPRRLIKFVSLTVGLLMIGAVVTCMVYGQAWWLAVAAGVVGAWALLVCFEVIKDELREAVQPTSETSTEHDHEQTWQQKHPPTTRHR